MKKFKNLYSPVVSLFLIMGLALNFVSCRPVCQKMEPLISCPPPIYHLSTLPSPFSDLSAEERKEEWAKEMLIGLVFAKEGDLYRAITCYKRALILMPASLEERHLQADYELIFCYYLGAKYQEALNIFEASELSQATSSFPGFDNLLLIVYDCYLQTHQEEKASCLLEVIGKFSTDTATDLQLYQTLKSGEIEEAGYLISEHREAEEMQNEFDCYHQFAKSPTTARTLNAILPGAGYYYVGQRRSALTSFVINALFTAAAYQFFNHGYTAAGAITASIETGWYLGGINGAGIEAQEFNTRLYEGVSKKILHKHTCFPILMFETSF